MKRTRKWILPAILLVLVTLVFSYGSLAAFSKSFSSSSAPVSAKGFTFYVNESATQQQSLGDVTLAVGQSKDYPVYLDGRSCETAVDATVTLTYTYEGTWPDGLAVLCDGQSANSGYTRTFSQLQSTNAVQSLTYTVVWNNPDLGSYEAFRGFALHLTVTVNAVQPE
ncbi:MAG: hypothetical protein LLF75_01440 [Eubacteriales bacterium]|nr:hypothetical protein [Eubacteriales bacterium]